MIPEIAHGSRNDAHLGWRLQENDLADFYIWLSRNYPREEGPRVGPRESIGNFRDGLLSALRNRGTPESCRAIERIAGEFPDLQHIKWVLVEAKKVTLRRTWIPPTPDVVLELARTREVRFVQSAGQLLSVVIDSLQELERKLQGETPAAPYLWNEVAKGQWRPKDENDLANYHYSAA